MYISRIQLFTPRYSRKKMTKEWLTKKYLCHMMSNQNSQNCRTKKTLDLNTKGFIKRLFSDKNKIIFSKNDLLLN